MGTLKKRLWYVVLGIITLLSCIYAEYYLSLLLGVRTTYVSPIVEETARLLTFLISTSLGIIFNFIIILWELFLYISKPIKNLHGIDLFTVILGRFCTSCMHIFNSFLIYKGIKLYRQTNRKEYIAGMFSYTITFHAAWNMYFGAIVFSSLHDILTTF